VPTSRSATAPTLTPTSDVLFTPGSGSRTRCIVPTSPFHNPSVPGACYAALMLSDDLCLAAGLCGHLLTMMTYEEQVSARTDNDQSGDVIGTRTLWTGGVVTAVIVGGLTIAGFLLIEGILRYPLLGDRANAQLAPVTMVSYAVGAAVAALLATTAMHVLLMTTHRPQWFFAWLGGIGTAIAVLLPLTQHLPAALATATVNLGLGLTIIGLVRHTGAASARLRGVARADISPAYQLRRRIMSPHREKQTAIP